MVGQRGSPFFYLYGRYCVFEGHVKKVVSDLLEVGSLSWEFFFYPDFVCHEVKKTRHDAGDHDLQSFVKVVSVPWSSEIGHSRLQVG